MDVEAAQQPLRQRHIRQQASGADVARLAACGRLKERDSNVNMTPFLSFAGLLVCVVI
jgi:hypothetical protein